MTIQLTSATMGPTWAIGQSPRGDAGRAGCLSRLSDVTDATGGVRTLREAVVLSNEAIGSDSIQFSSGLAAIIQLRQSPLTIRDTLTIVGPGSSQIGINDLRVTARHVRSRFVVRSNDARN